MSVFVKIKQNLHVILKNYTFWENYINKFTKQLRPNISYLNHLHRFMLPKIRHRFPICTHLKQFQWNSLTSKFWYLGLNLLGFGGWTSKLKWDNPILWSKICRRYAVNFQNLSKCAGNHRASLLKNTTKRK